MNTEAIRRLFAIFQLDWCKLPGSDSGIPVDSGRQVWTPSDPPTESPARVEHTGRLEIYGSRRWKFLGADAKKKNRATTSQSESRESSCRKCAFSAAAISHA